MADFSNYKKTTFQDIYDYVKAEKPEYLDTLTEAVEGGDSYLTIKKAFYKAYFPEFIPVAKPKKPTMKDLLGIKTKE